MLIYVSCTYKKCPMDPMSCIVLICGMGSHNRHHWGKGETKLGQPMQVAMCYLVKTGLNF